MTLRGVLFLCFVWLAGCSNRPTDLKSDTPIPGNSEANPYKFDGVDPPQPEADPYPGTTIDQVFPISFESSFGEKNETPGEHSIWISGYDVKLSGFAPVGLSKGQKRILGLATNSPKTDYWSSLIGTSHLLGPESEELYVVSTGPGGVCCTNYWIVDISKPTARLIFRSEEFGRFREPMEIFDADGDGVYELVQSDSCMRYFRDDCGSCSPEPRAHFRYDRSSRRYRPTKGIMQDFVREQQMKTEKWLAEQYDEYMKTKDVRISYDLHRSVISHVADLLHIGKDRRAWAIFHMYEDVVDEKDRKEILQRLSQCKFYKALKARG